MTRARSFRISVSIVSMFLCGATGAQAHEFWMVPDQFAPVVNARITLSLFVGEHFRGDPVGFGRPMAASLRWYRLRGNVQLTAQLPDDLAQSSITMAFDRPGAQLIAMDTQPNTIELPADKFNGYLREEGLEHVIARREATGQGAKPGRERYRRHIKTVLNVGGKSDKSFGVHTGQTLEIVPLVDPYLLRSGSVLPMQVFFKGVPLKGALVKAWSRHGSQLHVIATRTDAAGKSAASLPKGGIWMVSVVHMVPIPGSQSLDWDSHWGNLTLEIPANTRAQ